MSSLPGGQFRKLHPLRFSGHFRPSMERSLGCLTLSPRRLAGSLTSAAPSSNTNVTTAREWAATPHSSALH